MAGSTRAAGLVRSAVLVRWVRGSRPLLRLLYLLTGSALALSFLTVDLAVAGALWDREPVVLSRLLFALVVFGPPTLLGLVPQLRHIEGAAAGSLLGVDFRGHAPGLTRTWDQRWRTVAWFWAHLAAGGFAGGVAVGWVMCMDSLVRSSEQYQEARILDLSWAAASGIWATAALALVGLLLILVGLLLLLACGEALVQLAPLLLGPSVPELLAELESRTTHLVERTRLARELHDSVGHALSVVVLHTAVARRHLPPNVEQVAGSLEIVGDVAHRALEDLDAFLGLLREDQEAPQRQPVHDLGSLDGLVRASREGGQRVIVRSEVADLTALPPVVSREAYRIVQEGLTNALRHAPGQEVHVRLACLAEGLLVQVANPLAKPTAGPNGGGGGRGLVGVRERVQVLDGSIQVGTKNGMWVLDVSLPLPRQEGR